MPLDLLFALVAFAVVASGTPGPNLLMVMASGANFGIRRTVPHMAGIALGFGVMIVVIGVGLMQVFETWPLAQTVLRVVSFAYLLWLAFKIAAAGSVGRATSIATPLNIWQGAAFQWVNPKAWAVAMAAISLYAPAQDLHSVLTVAGVFVAISPVITFIWALLGRAISRLLTKPTHLRIFNISMAILLVGSFIPVLLQQTL